jgi:hypothetical protein
MLVAIAAAQLPNPGETTYAPYGIVLMERTLARKRPKPAFEEGQAAFVSPATDLDTIYAAWDYRCAFTGQDLRREAAADPLGWLLRLGTGVMVGHLIPASMDAIYAYERRHLALGARHEFLVALDVISPELLEKLNPIGRLTMPADTRFHPDAGLLEAHRTAFAAGITR